MVWYSWYRLLSGLLWQTTNISGVFPIQPGGCLSLKIVPQTLLAIAAALLIPVILVVHADMATYVHTYMIVVDAHYQATSKCSIGFGE